MSSSRQQEDTPERSSAHFVIRTDEDLEAGLRRVAREQIELARACLQDISLGTATDPDKTVHELRKATKKLRAWLHLCAAKAWRHPLNDRLRQLARSFSAARDSLVLEQTAEGLDPDAPETGRWLRMHTQKTRDPESLRSEASAWLSSIHELEQHFDAWCPKRPLGSVIADNVRRVLKRARKAWRKALETGDGGDFHETRKAVKRLWYHACLLRNTDRDLWDTLEPALDAWADALGDDHDLHVLQGELEHPGAPSGKERKALRKAAERRQQKLRHDMHKAAAIVLEWKPKALAERIRQRLDP